MPFPSLSRRARRGLVALALALPLLSLASLAAAAAWVHAHGGLAASIATLARSTAFLAGGLESLPGTLTTAQAAILDHEDSAGGFSWAVAHESNEEDEDDFSFAYVEPNGNSSFSMNDDRGRSRRLDRLMRSAEVPTLWFREGDVEYVVTDAATVARARELCEPLQRIGGEMGRVGGEMGRIGGRMGRYGGRLGTLGGRLGGVSARLATTRMSESQRDRLEAERDRIQAEMERVQAEMKSEEQGSVRERQAELSRRMDALQEQHRPALAKARTGLRQLFEEVRSKQKGERIERSERSERSI